MDDLGWMIDDMERMYFSPKTDHSSAASFLPSEPGGRDAAVKIFRHNWQSVKAHQQLLGKALLARILRKQQEVERLGDSVSWFFLRLAMSSQSFIIMILNLGT